jgi:hypothetical protein
MRLAFVIFAAVAALLGCAHAPEGPARPKCPESEMASQCTSGGLKCEVDEKRSCELCRCERTVF